MSVQAAFDCQQSTPQWHCGTEQADCAIPSPAGKERDIKRRRLMLTSSEVSYKEISIFEMLRFPIDLFNKSLKIQI